MGTHYTQLFAIQCLHDYFADGLCRVLTLSPTAECRRMLARYQCLFRPTAGGGEVYYDEHDGSNRLQLYREEMPFTFTLTSTDPLLATYTETDGAADAGSPGDTVYYFSNLEEQTAELYGKERLLLHPPGQALTRGPLPVTSSSFSYVFDQAVSKANLQVLDLSRERVVWESQTPEQEVGSFPLDLGALGTGRYVLNVNGKTAWEFYLSDRPPVKDWGIVEIFAGGPAMAERVPERCQVIDASGNPRSSTFSLHLDNRRTCWRYCIISTAPDERSFDGYQIVGTNKGKADEGSKGTQGLQFARKADKVLPGGQLSLVFESQQDIPLLQFPADEHVFTFRANGQGEGGGSAIKLPYPRADTTRLEVESGKRRMLSEVFVYL
jgi:hypothetical protein